jgi:uncharacterized lipoprotein
MRNINLSVAFPAGLVIVTLLAGCSVNVKKQKGGQDKDVDIKTPLGAIHVSKGANPRMLAFPFIPALS